MYRHYKAWEVIENFNQEFDDNNPRGDDSLDSVETNSDEE